MFPNKEQGSPSPLHLSQQQDFQLYNGPTGTFTANEETECQIRNDGNKRTY